MIEIFTFLILSVFLALFLSQGRLDFFSPISIFCYWGVGQYALSPIFSSYFLGYQFNEYTIALVFFSMFSVFFSYSLTRPGKFSVSIPRLLPRKVVSKRVFFLVMSGASLLNFYIYRFYGGFSLDIFSRGHEFRFFLSNDGRALVYFYIVKSLFVLPFIYFSFLLYSGFKLRFVHFVYFPAALIMSLILGSKGIFLGVLLNGILLYNFHCTRLSVFSVVVFSLGLLVTLLGFYHLTGLNSFGGSSLFLIVISIFVSRLDVMRNLDLFIREILEKDLIPDHLYSFASLPLQYFPRSFFNDKPYMFSPEMTRLLRYDVFVDRVTYDFSAIAESIYNFGWFGALLPGILIGFILKKIQLYYARGNPFIAFSFVYLFFSGLPMSLMSSGFIASSPIVFLPLNILLCFGIYFLCFRAIQRKRV